MKLDDNIFLYQNIKYKNCKGCLEIILQAKSVSESKKIAKITSGLSDILYDEGFEIIGLYFQNIQGRYTKLLILSYNVEDLLNLKIPLEDYQLYGNQYFEYKNNATTKDIQIFNQKLAIKLKKKLEGDM